MDDGVLVEPPRCFLLHFCDDEVFGLQNRSMLNFVALLEPCRVVAMGLDEEALGCGSLDDLVSLFRQRILEDVQKDPCSAWPRAGEGVGQPEPRAADVAQYAERVVISGYGFGALVAHRVATALRHAAAELEVALVLIDSDITWPPSFSLERLGGYGWLGGRAEAALLMARGFGHMEFARDSVREALACLERGVFDEDDLLMRALWLLAPGGMTHKYFRDCVSTLAICLDVMHELGCAAQAPAQVFDGEALFLMSTSREFATAEAAAKEHCPRLEVVCCRGTHYTMLQEEHVRSVMPPLTRFFITRGLLGASAQKEAVWPTQLTVPGLRVVSHGDHPDAPTVYITHALRPYVTQDWLDRVAELLAPCRIVALDFDDIASQCETPQDLAAVYQQRISSDMQRGGAIAG